MKHFIFILSLIIFSSCGKNPPLEINEKNYKIVGKEGERGLVTKKHGDVVLEKKYKYLQIRYDTQLGESYVKYTTNDGRQGFYFNQFETPTIEVDSNYNYLKVINSKQYFVFTKPKKNHLGYSWQGVIDTEGNEVINNEYLQILHDGNKMFYIATDKNKNYRQFNLEKNQFNTPYYGWVYSKFGVTFASKDRDGGGDIWGAKGCFLDQEGNEITAHDFQSVGIHKAPFDKTKVVVTARKNNIHTVFYPDGQPILKDHKEGVYFLAEHSKISYQKQIEKFPNKNIVGIITKDKAKYFVTYEGELLKLDDGW